jgi:hypothetical protein
VARRPKVRALPAEVRADVDAWLNAHNFSGYEQLEQELAARGYHVGKSSLHRYGQGLERRLSAIKASTEAAVAIAAAAPDDQDLRSAAVMSIIQTDVFEILVQLQESEEVEPAERVKLLARVGKSIAELSRASVNQKKWADQVRARVGAALARAETVARTGGLSPEKVNEIRSAILGIAT